MHVSASQLTPNLDDSSIMCAIKQRTQSFMSWSRLCQKALRFTNASVQTCPSAKFKKTCPKSTVKSCSNVIPGPWSPRRVAGSMVPAKSLARRPVHTALRSLNSSSCSQKCSVMGNVLKFNNDTMTYYDIMICLKLSQVGMSMCLSSLTEWWTS
jgi:hypothetical protein